MRLKKLHQQHGEQVTFLLVYIREAHPVNGWWLGAGIPGLALKLGIPNAATDIYDPRNIEERRTVAQRCSLELALDIPMLVDGIDDAVNKAYAAWPTRLYLVGVDGVVVYAGGPGPFGFKPSQLDVSIAGYLPTLKQAED